jgi:hypothetical protein
MIQKSPRIEPLFQRLPSILAYPAAPSMLWMIAALCALRLLAHLPSLLGLAFEVIFWVMGFKLAVEALVNTAHGRIEPLGHNDLAATDGEAVQQMLLQVLVFVGIAAVAVFVGLVPALVMLGVAVLLMPAAIIMLAIDRSLPGALNPLAWGALIGRLGARYFGAVAVLAVLVVVSTVAQVVFARLLPNDMGTLPGGFVSLYALVAGYHLLGYLIYENHAALGLDVAPAVPRATLANPMEDEAVAQADALARDGDHAAAANLLQQMFRGRGASDPVHDRYRQHVIAAGDTPRLVRHGREYLSSLLATGKDKRALAVAVETMAHDPSFRHELPDDVARLVAQAARTGQAQLAVSLAHDFEGRFPGNERAPEVVLAAANLMAERLGQEQAAHDRLLACARHHPGHPLEPSLREAQANAGRLLGITGRAGGQG